MNIGIVGLGLIGGSLGRAIKNKTDGKVFAYDLDKDAMIKGKLLSAYDFTISDGNIKDIDILFFALYPKAFSSCVEDYVKKLKDGCVVIDLCGNKRKPVEIMKKLSEKYPKIVFTGGHPMAGREFSGVAHSTVNLFDGASMLITPVTEDLATLSEIKDFFLKIGFRQVIFTNPEEHDAIIAYTSQLAHLVSSSYIKSPTAKRQRGFSAGSFRDMTRVARLSPKMWTELMTDNADNLISELEGIIDRLSEYRDALKDKDEKRLYGLLEEGNELKLEDLKNPEKK
ncbi:MAG: prephenate dehydrogenase [Clostridia bacterium]|nr:prephenate dehydrogenase [Clostridia bacterium]